MDIIMKEAAFFVLCPKSFKPRAKIVGNIIDSKKKILIKAYTDSMPPTQMTAAHKAMLVVA